MNIDVTTIPPIIANTIPNGGMITISRVIFLNSDGSNAETITQFITQTNKIMYIIILSYD